MLSVVKLFEHLRAKFEDKVELLHDTHERVPPILGIQLAKDLEKYRPFFLEDPVSPEDIGYFRNLRQQTSTPIAMGELFNSPHEWTGLVSERLIDFIRVHMSQMGGLTMARTRRVEPVTCGHPDRPHYARGMCLRCYFRDLRRLHKERQERIERRLQELTVERRIGR